MKQFFYILFGGLAIIVISLFVIKVNVAIKSTKYYSATEEEDKVNTTYALWSTATTTVTAKDYVVMDTSDGSILVGHNQDTLVPIASLTKLITAAVVKEDMSGDQRITISKKILSTYGNSAGFKDGETFTADDLLYPLLMVSSNDAAEALAGAYNGTSNNGTSTTGRQGFIKAMNDFCQSIGAYRTYFADPAGLSPSSVSTAHDIALILNWIRLNQPSLLEVTLQQTMTMRSHTWVNPTHFLSWSYYLGGKNGYTPEADRTGASLFQFSSTTPVYAIVVLGSASRDSDVVSLVKQIQDSKFKL